MLSTRADEEESGLCGIRDLDLLADLPESDFEQSYFNVIM
jgi:hypothetical protein